MRSVGLGVYKEGDADEQLLKKISELESENAALKEEIEALKAKKSTRKSKTDADPAEE